MKLNWLKNADYRTSLIRKNIFASFFLKVFGAIIQLLLVPLTLNCLNQYEYGIWLTISSILVWMDTMDLGLGNGLRNKLSEAIVKNDIKRARRLVSTAVLMLIIIVVPVVITLCAIICHLDCHSILNVSINKIPNLNTILVMCVTIVGITFIFKFIGNIYLALQLPSINNALIVGGQTLAFALIFVFSRFCQLSLIQISALYTLSPFIVYLIATPITFHKYAYLTPKLDLFDKNEIGALFSLSIKFFAIQFFGMMIFSSSNIIISNVLSPSEVTPYQISYRYFSIVNVMFTIISAPLWSATTDAYAVGDIQWIKKTMDKMRHILIGFAIVLVLMAIVSPIVYKLWIGDSVAIPMNMSCLMAVYMFVIIYGTCFSNIICGIGTVTVLTIITISESLIYIPLAVFGGRELGSIGIILALISVNTISAVVNRLQYQKLISGIAEGLWKR